MKSSIGKNRDSSSLHEDTDSIPTTPVTERPSLALNFELSPPDKPMFYSERSASGSSGFNIQYSSPITVPIISKCSGSGSRDTTPVDESFVVATIPNSPAPLQRTSIQEYIVNNVHSESSVEPEAPPPLWQAEVATPMPGTNLPLDEHEAPQIVVSTPSASDKQRSDEDGYFALSAIEEKKAEHSNALTTIENAENAEPGDSVLGHRFSQADGAHSIAASSSRFDEDPFVFDEETRKSFEDKNQFVAAYLAQAETEKADSSIQRRCSTWGGHTGLYDGTGYGPGSETTTTSSRPLTSSTTGTDNTDNTTEDEVSQRIVQALDAIAIYQAQADAPEECSSPVTEEPPVVVEQPPVVQEPPPINEKEALQEIIRAYAIHPMLYDDEAKDEQTFDPTTDHEGELCDNDMEAKAREEVALSIRIMNKTLGG
ncbi:hypothetical protein P154DRAFT_535022 [Amniculicola lignicola CBS 123094]|uniref:Uncharacterized protein n=1 Tax=Amniculicola lignicola CBS 123094 TaxID=1392246 RepID=A0A6A5WGY8_9PLEO|nr:hypothetical protein P154DRAFT_535022 [Amniculicola lignicola CBS 123094]